MEKVFTFTVGELKEYIQNHGVEILRETPEKLLEILDLEIHREPLNEMAKMNLKDPMNSPFPPNKFDIIIWSNDHNPPHFHIKGPEEWEVTFTIETGKPLKVKHIGKSSKYYKYMVDNVPIWLNMLSYPRKKNTNREILEDEWNRLHK